MSLGGCPEACLPCKRLFSSRVAWTGHAARIHGYRSKAHILARSRVCLACGKQYASAGRLRRHLVTATRCVQSWGVFTPLTPDDGEGADDHAQRPPIAVPGSFGDPSNFISDVPPDVSSGLLQALNSLPECDESVVWDTVVEYIEPLQVLRETVQYWRTAAPDSLWVQQAAENVLLLLDPDLVGEPDSAQQCKVRKHAFALGHSPDWCPLPSFCLPTSSVGPCFDLADPPPVTLDPHSATSVQLRLGQAYSTWLEQACAVLAKGLAIAQATGPTLQQRFGARTSKQPWGLPVLGFNQLDLFSGREVCDPLISFHPNSNARRASSATLTLRIEKIGLRPRARSELPKKRSKAEKCTAHSCSIGTRKKSLPRQVERWKRF